MDASGAKGTRITRATNQDRAKQGTPRHVGFASKRRDIQQGPRPKQILFLELEDRSPLVAVDIITTEANRGHTKLEQKPSKIRFCREELWVLHTTEKRVIQKSMLLTTGPHTSKVKVSSDQPWQMGYATVMMIFSSCWRNKWNRAKFCFLYLSY